MSKIKIHIPLIDYGEKYPRYGQVIMDGQFQYQRNEIHELLCEYMCKHKLADTYILGRKSLDIASWIYLNDGKFRWATEDVDDIDKSYKQVEWKEFIK